MTRKEFKSKRSESILWMAVMLNFAMPFIYLMVAGIIHGAFNWFYCIMIVSMLMLLFGIIAHDLYGEYKTYQSRKHFTCTECSDARWCRYAFDGYNTKGDCLAIK